MLFKILLVIFLICPLLSNAQSDPPKERICGKWESTAKNLKIQVYVDGAEFRAKIIWFRNTGGKPMDYWTDVNNPDPALRSRKLIGMSILKDLTYNRDTNSWENGMVYDSIHGKYWNASAYIGKKGLLHVRGYWHFKFIGKTLTFQRI